MALSLKFNITFGTSSIVVYDNTCSYNSCSNEGGYGTPNESFTDAISARLEITPLGATAPIIITDIFDYLPNDNGTGYEIFYDDLNLNEIPVGEWKFKYVVEFPNNVEYEKECWFLNTCPIELCLAERVKKIDIKCGSDYDGKTFELIMLLNGAKSIHGTCDYEKAHKIVLSVYNQCKCCC